MTVAFQQDCIEYMKTLPDLFFDLGHCDPPYGIREDTRANKSRGGFVKQRNGSEIYVPASDFGDEPWDNNAPPQEYFDELFRVCKRVILWGANYYDFNQRASSTGVIVWNKGKRKSKGQSDGEVAWTNLHKSVRIVDYLWDGFQQGRSVTEPLRPHGNKALNEKRLQNGHKPILLYELIISRFYQPGWKIFDSHLGAGSHRIACEKNGFEFVGTEVSPKRFEQQAKRFAEWKANENNTLFNI